MAALIFRLIMIGAFIWLGWRLYKLLTDKFESKTESDTKSEASSEASSEAIVPCAFCGVHVQESRALQHEGKFFCSQDHLQQHLNKQD